MIGPFFSFVMEKIEGNKKNPSLIAELGFF